jgi:F-type H+-transporting ATPase subunit alpha
LLERAAKLSDEKGGGSLTALPIIETQEGDVSAYIPTNVISITDGQIFLDSSLFNKGLRPAVDVGISVSRVGSSAQTKAMKKVGGGIRIELAQFRELEAFMQFAQDLDEATKKRIDSGQRMVELLKQKNGQPMPFYLQTVSIYAGSAGLFNGVPVAQVPAVEAQWLDFVQAQFGNIVDAIRTEKALGDDTAKALDGAIEQFKKAHTELFTS